ncbi:MAG: PspA/IM30 family protein [Planctomycetaceae bacterium]|nr:PspA/IM30 family protein [Planctomycetaceae bacterium]
MSYFSRLTDIVTCNLSELLAHAADQKMAIEQIIAEMEEGLAGAKRSVATATASEDRLYGEIHGHREQWAGWAAKAKEHLLAGREAEARQCLVRKREIEDLIAGLEQQHHAAMATRKHLSTIHRALEARLAEAIRRRAAIQAGVAHDDHQTACATAVSTAADDRFSQIDAELEALKRELAG